MNSLLPPPPPPAVPVPARALAVDPSPPLEVEELAELVELVLELAVDPEEEDLDVAAGVRETRDVAERKAADPPPVCCPLVEVMVGAPEASWEELEDELEEELPLLLPREFD